MEKKKKYSPKIPTPDDNADTIYCGENSDEYNNYLNAEDVFPYNDPMPTPRRRPDPPII